MFFLKEHQGHPSIGGDLQSPILLKVQKKIVLKSDDFAQNRLEKKKKHREKGLHQKITCDVFFYLCAVVEQLPFTRHKSIVNKTWTPTLSLIVKAL